MCFVFQKMEKLSPTKFPSINEPKVERVRQRPQMASVSVLIISEVVLVKFFTVERVTLRG